MAIIFSEGSGVAESVYGKTQAPIRMFLEARGEAWEQESALPHLFTMGTSDNYADMYTSMSAMEDFEPVGENGAYPNATMSEGFQKMLVYMTWKNSFTLSAEIMEDGKTMDLKSKPSAFMTSYNRTRERFGAALYGTAFAGKDKMTFHGKTFDATTADKQTLFSVAHPSKIDPEMTQTNMFSDAFSAKALDEAESRMHTMMDDKGNILDVTPDTILIPEIASLKRAVFAAIGSDKEPDSANNGFNYQYGRWNVVIWPFLNQFITAATAPWALIDSQYNKDYGGAPWNDRISLTVKSVIDDNDANVWKGRSRFNACFNDWRYICAGGMPAGTQLVGA